MIREITIAQGWSRQHLTQTRKRRVEAEIPRVREEIRFLEATLNATRQRLSALESEYEALCLSEEWEVW